MKKEAVERWSRAIVSIQSAKLLLATDPDASASRAYYSAFYAVSALFVLQGKSYSKHSAVETAVHRDLVKPGIWPGNLGSDYSSLLATRITGDYDMSEHVSANQAKKAIQSAQRILLAVHEAHPDVFPDKEGILCQDLV